MEQKTLEIETQNLKEQQNYELEIKYFYTPSHLKPQLQLQQEQQILQNLLHTSQQHLSNAFHSPSKPFHLSNINYLTFKLALNLYQQNDYKQAENIINQALKTTPYYSPFHFLHAYIQEKILNTPPEIYRESYQKCLDTLPNQFHIIALLKTAEIHKFDFKRLQVYKEIEKIDADFWHKEDFYMGFLTTEEWINLLSGVGKNDLALHKVLNLFENDKNNVELCYLLIRIHQRMNNYKQCQVYAKRCLELDPKCVKALYFKAYCIEELDKNPDTDLILQIYQQTLKIDPQLVNSYVSIANIHNNEENFDKSLIILKKAIQLFPEESFVQIYMGNYYMLTQVPSKAIECYILAIKLSDYNPMELYQNIGQYYEHIESKKKAIQYYYDVYLKQKDLREKIFFQDIKEAVNEKIEKKQNRDLRKQRIKLQLLNYYNKFYFTKYFRKDIHLEIVQTFVSPSV